MTKITECCCQKCASACRFVPGWFKPGEAEILAKNMGLTLKELFDKHLGINYWERHGDGPDIFILCPAVTKISAGSVYPADPRGTCVFLKDEKCSVHAQGKPFECAAYHHSDLGADVTKRHEEIAMLWDKPEHQQQIVELLGHQPYSNGEFTILDMLGMGGF